MLAYLIEMAHIEASDLVRGDRRAASFSHRGRAKWRMNGELRRPILRR